MPIPTWFVPGDLVEVYFTCKDAVPEAAGGAGGGVPQHTAGRHPAAQRAGGRHQRHPLARGAPALLALPARRGHVWRAVPRGRADRAPLQRPPAAHRQPGRQGHPAGQYRGRGLPPGHPHAQGVPLPGSLRPGGVQSREHAGRHARDVPQLRRAAAARQAQRVQRGRQGRDAVLHPRCCTWWSSRRAMRRSPA